MAGGQKPHDKIGNTQWKNLKKSRFSDREKTLRLLRRLFLTGDMFVLRIIRVQKTYLRKNEAAQILSGEIMPLVNIASQITRKFCTSL